MFSYHSYYVNFIFLTKNEICVSLLPACKEFICDYGVFFVISHIEESWHLFSGVHLQL